MLKGNEVKKILKASGIDSKKVSVTTRAGAYEVGLKSWSISKSEVEKILGHLKNVNRCEATGEILSGGNTFLFVTYECSEALPVDLVSSAIAQNWDWGTTPWYNKTYHMANLLASANPNYDKAICQAVIDRLSRENEEFKNKNGL